MVFDKLKPFYLSDKESLTLCVSFVYKDRSFVKSDSICSDNITVLISEDHVLVSIDLKSNFIGAINKENYFSNLVEFIQQNGILFFSSGLQ